VLCAGAAQPIPPANSATEIKTKTTLRIISFSPYYQPIFMLTTFSELSDKALLFDEGI
jgi:hypothetical protein